MVAYRANTTAESLGVEEDKGSTPSKRFPAANQFKKFRTAFNRNHLGNGPSNPTNTHGFLHSCILKNNND